MLGFIKFEKKTVTVTYFKAHETQQKQCVVYKLRHLYNEHQFKESKVCETKLLFSRSFLPKLNTSQIIKSTRSLWTLNCQNQSKSQIMFHKKNQLQDLYTMILLHVHKVHKQSMKRGLNSFDGTITAHTILWTQLWSFKSLFLLNFSQWNVYICCFGAVGICLILMTS